MINFQLGDKILQLMYYNVIDIEKTGLVSRDLYMYLPQMLHRDYYNKNSVAKG